MAVSAWPQALQKRLAGGLAWAHVEQTKLSGAPQLLQNLEPGGFSVPQVEHPIGRLSREAGAWLTALGRQERAERTQLWAAIARTMSERLTIPRIAPFAITGTRLIRCLASSVAISSTVASSPTLMTSSVITSETIAPM